MSSIHVLPMQDPGYVKWTWLGVLKDYGDTQNHNFGVCLIIISIVLSQILISPFYIIYEQNHLITKMADYDILKYIIILQPVTFA